MALKQKGESERNLDISRAHFGRWLSGLRFSAGRPSIDVVGTGGDRLELINVSTTCMFVLAAAGVVVLKHGNRAITSKCGAADVLEALGIPITCATERMLDCIHQTGIGFLFALCIIRPSIAAPIRKTLAEQGSPQSLTFSPFLESGGTRSPAHRGIFADNFREIRHRRCARLDEAAPVVHGQVFRIRHGRDLDAWRNRGVRGERAP